MILYLTHNDQPSGVYWSQVTDAVAYLNTLGGPRVRLVALVSGRAYFSIRRKIRQHCPQALVLPMVPGVRRWRMNRMVVHAVCRLLRPSGILARGAMATWMALRARDKGLVRHVCFDARGAYAAEWEEYRLIDDDALIAQVRPVEAEALERSDLRLAVSQALVDHWRQQYGYAGNAHVVVPCTLGEAHLTGPTAAGSERDRLGFAPDDVVLAYAGSASGWQSFDLLDRLLRPLLAAQPRVKVLLLCPPDPRISALIRDFPARVVTDWVASAAVPAVLRSCDAALLLREDSITNRVASPTKFAEYLACGLPVVISAHIGDFSALVVANGLGIAHAEGEALPVLERPAPAERARLRAFALERFTKPTHAAAYRQLLAKLA